MADNLRKFTTQEVLNKVYSDSSGNSIGINAATSKETLNAALDTTNSRLNVSLSGGTISGDVTITGDLTVNGDGVAAYDEIVNGQLVTFRDDASTVGTNDNIVIENDGSGDASLKFSLTGATDWFAYVDNSDSDKFKIRRSTTDHFTIDESGNSTFAGSVGVGASPVSSFPAQNVTIEGATAGLVLRDSTGSNQATQFFTLYSSNGDIIGMFDDSKSLKFGHADDAVGTNYEDVLTLGSDNSATFTGDITVSKSGNAFLNLTSTGGGARIKLTGQANETTNGLLFYEASNQRGQINYNHSDQKMEFKTGDSTTLALTIDSSQNATFAGDVKLTSSTSSSPFLTIENTNADDNMGGLKFIKDSASPNTSDKLMQIWAYGDNDFAEQILYSEIATLPTSVADGSEEGSMRFRVMNAGSFVETMRIKGNKVGIGTSSPDNELHITDGSAGSVTANSNSQVTIESNSNASLQFLSPNNANSIIYFGDADDNDVGYINYVHSSNTMNFQAAVGVRMSLDANSRISLSNNDGGDSNTIFGKSSGLVVTGSHNVFLGQTAGDDIVEGSYNIAIGSDALGGAKDSTADASDFNIFIGVNSGNGAWVTAVSQYNTGIGHYTLSGAMNGALNNTAVGYQSMLSITTGDNNTAIGSKSLNSAQLSQNNVAVGYLALEELTFNGNSYNTALGVQSGQELTTGIKNTFVGAFSGYSSTDVDNAVVVGYSAGGAVMTDGADGAVAIGTFALDALTSGARNLAVGYNAGTGITTGTDNTLVGWGAGDGLTGGATSNTLIGAEAEASSAGGTNQIAIGAGAVGQGSNTVVLGKSSVSAIYAARNASASVEASAFNVGSDRKLKKNIRDTALQGINLIDQMQVRDFEWKDNDVTVNGGLIAQELEAIYPDAVGKRNDDGDDGDVTMTISRESIVPLLIKAVQELSAKVKELESN